MAERQGASAEVVASRLSDELMVKGKNPTVVSSRYIFYITVPKKPYSKALLLLPVVLCSAIFKSWHTSKPDP